MLTAHLAEIGVDPENPVFDWNVKTERPDLLLVGDSIKGTFDAANPSIGTAAHGQDGVPAFIGGGPVLVDVSAAALEAGSPLDVLLLHHTNAPGRQWEVVGLVQGGPGNLSLAVTAPEKPIEADATAEVAIVVTNDGAVPAPAVTLAGTASGGQIVSTEPSQGHCGQTLGCSLGDIAPGASVEVKATVRPANGQTTVTIQATAKTALPCETNVDDNAASVSIDVLPGPAPVLDEPLRPGGGCSCSTSAAMTGIWPAGSLLALLGLAIRRRAKRR